MKYHPRHAHLLNGISYAAYSCLFLLSFFLSSISIAQPKALPVNIQTLTVEDGLSQSVVYSMAQDSKGFIWIGTFNGLDRYDGNEFIHFRHQPDDSFSISSNQVSEVYEDSRHRLWVGTFDNGLNYFDPVYRRFYHFFPGQKVLGLAEDAAGNLYVNRNETIIRMVVPWSNGAGSAAGAHEAADTAVYRVPDRFFAFGKIYMNVVAGLHHNLFAATRSGLFSLAFDTGKKTFSLTPLLACHLPKEAEVPQLMTDRHTGRYYFLTGEAVLESNDSHFLHPVKVHDGIPYYQNTFIDDSSRLWYTGRETNFLFNLKTHEDKVLASGIDHPGYDFGHLSVKLQDATGTFWLSTSDNGLVLYSDQENHFHSLLAGNYVGYMKAVSQDDFAAAGSWMVHADQNGNTIKKLAGKEGAEYFYTGFRRDKSGTCWRISATGDSVVGYRPGKGIVKVSRVPYHSYGAVQAEAPTAEGLPPGNAVYSAVYPDYLFLDRDDCLWLYAGNGFWYYDTRKNTYYFKKSDHFTGDNNYKKRMYEDVAGTVWMSISGGICTHNKTSDATRLYLWKPDAGNHSLADNNITSFCDDPADPQQIIWIGTRNGLSRMNKQTGVCRNFTEKDGLPNNVIYNILPDINANLWMSTNNGLCRLQTAGFGIRNFTKDDGLQGSEFNGDASLILDNGMFVFGGTQGLTYFNPDDIKPISPPHTAITGCRVFGRSLSLDSAAASGQDIAYAKDISISYRDNIVFFTFAGVDYCKLHSLHYRYKLVPFDKKWNDAGTASKATYTNLDPGDYTFMAEASNTNGVWGTASEGLHLHVLPLWWQTWWFRLLAVMAGVLCMYALYRYRLRQVMKLEKVRNNIARDLHDEIGSTLSTISIYSAIAQQHSDKPQANAQLLMKKINENAGKVMETMSDIVWSINTKNDTFENIFNRMQEHAIQLLELKGYALHFHFDEVIEHKKFDIEKRKNFYLLYKEALNNIAKYAQGNNVWIQATDKRSHLVLTIRDDGKGFDIDNTRKSGNGLTNMQSRATSIGGEILMTSREGLGTEVTVSIPYR